jgi:hypothetical protein
MSSAAAVLMVPPWTAQAFEDRLAYAPAEALGLVVEVRRSEHCCGQTIEIEDEA